MSFSRLGVCAFLLSALLARPAVADQQLVKRLRAEAVPAWTALRDFNLGLQGTVTDESVPVTGFPETIRSTRKHTFLGYRGQLLHHWENRNSRRSMDFVRAINQDYSFEIQRPAPGDPWIIRYQGGDKARTMDQIQTFGSPLFVSHTIDMQDLVWTVNQPGFDALALSQLTKDDRDLLKLDFASTSFMRDDYQIRGGWILLDPARHWAIVEYELQLQLDTPAVASARVEYGTDVDGFPIPHHYVYDFKANTSKGDFHRTRTCDYQLVQGQVADSEFRLAAFGLPEPNGKRMSTWVVMNIVGLVCLVVSMSILRWRHTTRSVASTS